MKLEEILPDLREGKKVRRNNWYSQDYINIEDNEIIRKESKCRSLNDNDILAYDWEIYEEPKKKVKYYPVLYQCRNENKYRITIVKYNSKEDFDDTYGYQLNDKFIRLITEIPELIEEREE